VRLVRYGLSLVVAITISIFNTGCATAAESSHRHGGFTSSGTVIGKDFVAQHQQWVMVGKQPYFVTLDDCWRFDLVWGPFSGWVCVDRSTWDRAQPGDRYALGQLTKADRP
jgi:hypothetical protein